VRLSGVLFIAQAFGDWLVGYLVEAGGQRLSRWLRGGEQQRAVQDAATAAIAATARQLRPLPAATDDPRGADHLARVIDQVFRQAPTPEESLAQQPTLLQGLHAGVAARLAVLADADITEVGQSSAEALELEVPVPALTDLLTSRLLWEMKVRGARGGPLKPLVDQLNHDVTHLQGLRHGTDLARLAEDVQAVLAVVGRLEQQAALAPAGPAAARRLLQAHCRIDEKSGQLPRVSALMDPIAMGVHPATPIAEIDADLKGGPEPPAAATDPPARVPVYVPRDLDTKLQDALAQGGLVLLHGDAAAGKSRAAYEMMRRLLNDRRVLIPTGRGSLRALRAAGCQFQDTVVWLDNLEGYLLDGLDTGLLHWLVGDGTRRVVVLATMRTSEYNRRDPSRDRDATAAERDLLRADRDLLDQAVVNLELERRFSHAELRRARERASDPRIADALNHTDRYGLAEYVAGAPMLWRRWRSARAVDSPLAERVGAALVAAAIDCRRAGFTRSAPEPILRDLLAGYLEDEPDAGQPAATAVSAGLAWATTRVQATTALLRQEAGGYVVFDYVLDQVQLNPDASPVPHVVWHRLLTDPLPEDAFSIGLAAWQTPNEWRPIHGTPGLAPPYEWCPIAERAFRAAADAGHHDAEVNLGLLLRWRGKLDAAKAWWRRAAQADHPLAQANLGALLSEWGSREEEDEAEALLRKAADRSWHLAEHNLGLLLERRGRVEEAEAWYRKAADAGFRPAQADLGVLLVEQHRRKEAEIWLRKAADPKLQDLFTIHTLAKFEKEGRLRPQFVVVASPGDSLLMPQPPP
jgi:tetratricopeptide (TPR) repeat protein